MLSSIRTPLSPAGKEKRPSVCQPSIAVWSIVTRSVVPPRTTWYVARRLVAHGAGVCTETSKLPAAARRSIQVPVLSGDAAEVA